jgi:hypothetical protein
VTVSSLVTVATFVSNAVLISVRYPVDKTVSVTVFVSSGATVYGSVIVAGSCGKQAHADDTAEASGPLTAFRRSTSRVGQGTAEEVETVLLSVLVLLMDVEEVETVLLSVLVLPMDVLFPYSLLLELMTPDVLVTPAPLLPPAPLLGVTVVVQSVTVVTGLEIVTVIRPSVLR